MRRNTTPSDFDKDFQPPEPPEEKPPITIQVKPKTWFGRLLARKIQQGQEAMTFTPHQSSVEAMREPSAYSQLQGLKVTSRQIVTGYDKQGNPAAHVTLWEKKADPGKKHYIVFTGKNGHIADTGLLRHGVEAPGYKPDGHLDFLKEMGERGAGFTVVTMRGYGNNSGNPSEDGFREDLQAFVADWKRRHTEDKASVPELKDVVCFGVSLGTANAAYLNFLMSKDRDLRPEGEPPPGLVMVNPFKCFHQVADYTLENKPFQHNTFHKFVPFKDVIRRLSFRVPGDFLESMLRHHFRTDEVLAQLDKDTKILFLTSSKDSRVPAENSAALMQVARENGLHAIRQMVYEGRGHMNIPVASMVRDVSNMFESNHWDVQVRPFTESDEEKVTRFDDMRDGVVTPVISTVSHVLLADARRAIATVGKKNVYEKRAKGKQASGVDTDDVGLGR